MATLLNFQKTFLSQSVRRIHFRILPRRTDVLLPNENRVKILDLMNSVRKQQGRSATGGRRALVLGSWSA